MTTANQPPQNSDAIDVSWYDESHHIIHWQFKNGWDWSSFLAGVEKTSQMVDEPPTVFVVIADFSENNRQPTGIFRLLPTSIPSVNPNYIGTVIFGNTFIKLMINAMNRLGLPVARKFKIADSLEACAAQARKMLQDYDS